MRPVIAGLAVGKLENLDWMDFRRTDETLVLVPQLELWRI